MRCLEKHPADRPQTATEVLSAIEMITSMRRESAAPPRTGARDWWLPSASRGCRGDLRRSVLLVVPTLTMQSRRLPYFPS
jgi:hypothetical protein